MLIKHEAKPSALLHRDRMPSALFRIMHKEGNALTILKNFHLYINMFAGPL